MAIRLDGKQLSTTIKDEIKKQVMALEGMRKPKLAVILVGDDPASQIYVASKIKACEQVGMTSVANYLPSDISQAELLIELEKLNQDDEVDGILVQLPLPKHLNSEEIINQINPDKDVDGFHPLNVGKLHLNQETFVPATPKGVMRLIETYDIKLEGKEVLVIGRSNLVGRPLAQLLLNQNATVTVAHSRTKDLKKLTVSADVVVAAAGVMNLIKPEDVKDGVILIDVGIHHDEDNKIRGDIDREAYEKASYYTPVPKGVGPMTIAMLLENTMQAYRKRVKNNEL